MDHIDGEIHHTTLPTHGGVYTNEDGNEIINHIDTSDDKNPDKDDRQDIYNIIRKAPLNPMAFDEVDTRDVDNIVMPSRDEIGDNDTGPEDRRDYLDRISMRTLC